MAVFTLTNFSIKTKVFFCCKLVPGASKIAKPF